MKYIYISQGQCEVREWAKKPNEQELQELVGGYFECYKIAGLEQRTLNLFCNEFGKPAHMPLNFFCDQLQDVIRGPALICAVDWDGEITGMTDDEVSMITVAVPPGGKVLPRLEIAL